MHEASTDPDGLTNEDLGSGVAQPGFASRLRNFSRGHEAWALMAMGSLGALIAITICFPFVTMRVIDEALPQRDIGALLENGAYMLALAVGTAIVWPVRIWTLSRYGTGVAASLRRRLVERMARRPLLDALRTPASEIQALFSKDLTLLETFLQVDGPKLLHGLPLALAGFTLLFVIEWRLAMLSLLGGAMVGAAPSLASGPYRRRSAARNGAQVPLDTCLGDMAKGQKVIRLFGVEAFWQDRFEALSKSLESRSRWAGAWMMASQGLTSIAGTLLQVVVLLGGVYLTLAEQMTMGELVAFLSVLVSIDANISNMGASAPHLLQARESVARLGDFLEAEPDDTIEAGATAGPLDGSLTVESVGFRYESSGPPALDGLSLEVRPGGTSALVGPSGSGKSTLLELLLGIRAPSEGAIRWNGVDLRDLCLRSVREHIAVVFQDTWLFDLSVADNIRMGKLDATDEEIRAAARAAEIADTVEALPRGYDTPVGGGGEALSGGQRQRIALARALVRQPSLLVLDEATSALDPQTEAAINRTLSNFAGVQTLLSVTHRLDSIRGYDAIYVLEDGVLVEHGDHDALMSQSGLYARMLRRGLEDTQGLMQESLTTGREADPAPPPPAAANAIEPSKINGPGDRDSASEDTPPSAFVGQL